MVNVVFRVKPRRTNSNTPHTVRSPDSRMEPRRAHNLEHSMEHNSMESCTESRMEPRMEHNPELHMVHSLEAELLDRCSTERSI